MLKKITVAGYLALTVAANAVAVTPVISSHRHDTLSIEYFLPEKGIEFNPDIPSPRAFFGFNPGEGFVDWNSVIYYMKELARTSDRVKLDVFDRTDENRPFIQLTVSSPENLAGIDRIRAEHLANTDKDKSGALDLHSMPLVLSLMASIHGNEASGVNAMVIAAYYLAAARTEKVRNLLENEVILINPGQNPDGINSFCHKIISNSSINFNVDKSAIEHASMQTGSTRQNHYWNDCNRDWLAIQFPEGRNGVRRYLEWMPNVVLDIHEHGNRKEGMFFFSPGDMTKVHECIPQVNQLLTRELSSNTGHILDSLTVSHFSECHYDDYFIGKGAAYGDVQGSVCLLHEQCGTYGHLGRYFDKGTITFASSVRNQCLAAFSVTCKALEMKDRLLEYQRDFFLESSRLAAEDPYKAYTFSSHGDSGTEYHMLDLLRCHNIEVYPSRSGKEWVVPCEQKHYRKIRTIFDTNTSFRDSLFYDISTWCIPEAFGLEFTKVKKMPPLGPAVKEALFPSGGYEGKSNPEAYAYSPGEYYSPAMTAFLQRNAVKVFVTEKGELVVPADKQETDREELHVIVDSASRTCGVKVKPYKVHGTDKLTQVREPHTAVIVGLDRNWKAWQQSGQTWYMLDKRYNMPHSIILADRMSEKAFDISSYDVIIFPTAFKKSGPEAKTLLSRLKKWVEDGGTLITVNEACLMAEKMGVTDAVRFTGRNKNGAARLKGVILKADGYRTDNPLMWGYDGKALSVFKLDDGIPEFGEGVSKVLTYSESPYLSGCISPEKVKALAGKTVVASLKCGKGNIIFLAEDMNFRSYWLGTSHILSNAIYFGNML